MLIKVQIDRMDSLDMKSLNLKFKFFWMCFTVKICTYFTKVFQNFSIYLLFGCMSLDSLPNIEQLGFISNHVPNYKVPFNNLCHFLFTIFLTYVIIKVCILSPSTIYSKQSDLYIQPTTIAIFMCSSMKFQEQHVFLISIMEQAKLSSLPEGGKCFMEPLYHDRVRSPHFIRYLMASFFVCS